jgi:gliding motility-associated-like protein
MKNRIIYSFLVFLGILISIQEGNATHVAGGNLFYECLGNQQYRVTLEFRRDCFNGNPLAQFDSQASIGIFDTNGVPIIKSDGGQVLIDFDDSDTLNTILTSECSIMGEDVCVEMTTYSAVITLPFNPTGYILSYQRCCRNIALNNIIDPLNQGSTYWTTISERAQLECNSAPEFNVWPDIFICANEPLIFDHSATDLDGDSLVYRLCVPSTGASQANPQPQPPGPPPYDVITWQPPFGLNDMMSGVPLTIDSQTGLLTATPNLVGQFLIGICVEEYRDGELLGFTRRDFEYNVRICDPRPTVTITPESDVNCEGLSGSFSVEVEPDNATYEWFTLIDGDTTFFAQMPEFEVDFPEAGFYTVGVAARDGSCVDTAFQSIYVAPPGFENIDIIDPGVVCSDTITLSATADPGATFEWFSDSGLTMSLGTGSSIETPLIGGSHTFFVVQTDSPCPEVDSITVQGFLPDVTVDLPDSPNVCLGTDYTISVTNNNPASNLSYQWGGDGTLETMQGLPEATFSFGPPGTYMITLLITDEDTGCSINFNYPVELFMNMPDVGVTLPPDNIICDGEDYSISLTNNNPSVPFSIVWDGDGMLTTSQGAPNATFTFPGPGTFIITLQLQDSDGCDSSMEFVVEVLEGPDDLNLEAFITPCLGDSAVVITNGNPDYIYNWSSDNVDFIFDANAINPVVTNINTSGTMFLDVFVDGFEECADSYEVIIDPTDEITINVTGQTSFCQEGELDLHAEANQPGDITWTDTNSGVVVMGDAYTVTITESTTLLIEFVGENGCTLEQSVDITVMDPGDVTINSSTGLIYCPGETVSLEAIFQGMGTVVWTDQDFNVIGNDNPIEVNPDGITSYNVSIEMGDCLGSATIELTPSMLSLELNHPSLICENGEVTINVNAESSSPVSFNYNFDEEVTVNSDSEIVITTDGSVSGTIEAVNEDGCSVTESVEILFDGITGFEASADPDVIIIGESTDLGTNGDGDWQYMWEPPATLDDPSSSDPVATPTDSTTVYTVTVTNDNGCTATDQVTVITRFPMCNEEDVYVPNLFTPNGDGFNDVFQPESNFIEEMWLIIYDRWGEKVFETRTLGAGWDGTFEGSVLDPDVYGYCLNVTCVNGTEYLTQGNITLMK